MNHILELFERSATAFPEKKAVADMHKAYSYCELKDEALRISGMIGSTRETDLIGVLTGRDALTVAMFAGVLYAGAAYVPLDPSLPPQKMDAIVRDTGLNLILGRNGEAEAVSTCGARFIAVDEALSGAGEAAGSVPVDKDKHDAQNPLYLIYTSGSTGEPKGIVKTHGAYISFIEAYIETFGFDESLVIGNQSPFHFDASAKDIYLAFAAGATLEIIPSELFMFGPKLVDYMNERGINFISWVPSALAVVAKLKTFDKVIPTHLKDVFFVGETCRPKTLRAWMEALPEARFVNLYGASEQAGIVCSYEVKELPDGEDLPIGKPLPHVSVTLRRNSLGEHSSQDESNRETSMLPPEIKETGQVGEIYIQSPALASGYRNDPEKTREVFIETADGVVFKTGDLARFDEEGNLVFASRSDGQIKHMGHRIELGEIETIVSKEPGIEQCCCLYNQDRERIVLFVSPDRMPEDQKAYARVLLSALREKMAAYMVPSRVIVKESMPLNANGKVDRMKLKEEL